MQVRIQTLGSGEVPLKITPLDLFFKESLQTWNKTTYVVLIKLIIFNRMAIYCINLNMEKILCYFNVCGNNKGHP